MRRRRRRRRIFRLLLGRSQVSAGSLREKGWRGEGGGGGGGGGCKSM